jgi:hypothetical protein
MTPSRRDFLKAAGLTAGDLQRQSKYHLVK